MRTVELRSTVTDAEAVELTLAEAEVPAPGPEQVLVRIEAAPVNPSDVGVMFAGGDVSRASAEGSSTRPVVSVPLSAGAARAAAARVGQPLPTGNEAAGTVLQTGSSSAARDLMDKVVCFVGGPTYTQYRLVDASACLALPEGATAADGAASFVNPMTALAMVETMRVEGHKGLVHTAAASSLGQMLARLCREDAVPLVNVVRSPEQVALLRDAGAEHVCDSTSDAFVEQLTAAIDATGATLAFDAIGGGRLAGTVLSAMEAVLSANGPVGRYGSSTHKQVYVYGSLDRRPTELNRNYGMAWGVGGWLLMPTLTEAGPERVAAMRRRVADGLTTTFATRFTDRVDLAGALAPEAIAAYGRPATGVKFMIVPNP